MSKNNLSILFWFFRAKTNRNNQTPIYLRESWSNKRKNVSTGIYILETQWDSDKKLVRRSHPDSNEINDKLNSLRSKINSSFTKMLDTEAISLDKLIEQLSPKSNTQHTIIDIINLHNNDLKKRIGIDYTKSTHEKYDILFKKIKAFLVFQYQKKDLLLQDLSLRFITDFEYYLKTHDRNSHNTVTKYLKNLKKIIGSAKHSGFIQTDPFLHCKPTYKDVDRVYLTKDELDRLKSKSIKLPRLALVRDLFVFQCYTGLAYSDMAQLKKCSVSPGVDGYNWIIIRRKKTNIRSAIPLLIPAQELIDKYDSKDKSQSQLHNRTHILRRYMSYNYC